MEFFFLQNVKRGDMVLWGFAYACPAHDSAIPVTPKTHLHPALTLYLCISFFFVYLFIFGLDK